ncbi:ABC transporter substrate-binding protein [Roseobacter sinensis]|uniref:ABC transporter substrate-binding protein n=1 Tax=Roseobacter sinensis TaxID=2931391 RepID=A0ABT3BIH3_9RHOB|nr:ABC transporter substrate-binding protein [Roseobacter sp. WL0113]MCV3273335.1 ABC transporter substrate-binding protein [Roseobacter sp. WL0113]
MRIGRTLTAAAFLALGTSLAQAQDFKIGLQEDPDVLDPDQSRTFVGRIVYASLCDKLVDITPDLEIVPALATGWEWNADGTELTMTLREDVVFHDGTPFNAEAVAANIDRSKNLETSRRKSEVRSIESWEVVDEFTIKMTLSAPDATLIAQFADRSGMMLSPTAFEAAGDDFGLAPVCAGPFKFVERIQQDRIVLEKFAEYYRADEISFDTVTFLPIPDTTVRLANLRAGDLDMLERLAATDVASVEGDDGLLLERATSLGYQGMTINVGNGDRADNPLGQSNLVRKALSLSIDRAALNQVVFEGAFAPGNQPFSPASPWYNADFPVPERDVETAKGLLAEAGFADGVSIEVQVANNPVQTQVMQVVQAMASEAGITIELAAKEFATLLADQSAGDYTASQVGWSGRVDPDGNIHQFMTTGGGINDSKYSNPEMDKLLNEARLSTDPAVRKQSYDAAVALQQEDMPVIYLYHQVWIWALDDSVSGFQAYPDGMIRLHGVSKG